MTGVLKRFDGSSWDATQEDPALDAYLLTADGDATYLTGVSVLAHGAVGDGVTSDSAAFTAAFAAAGANGRVIAPSGYNFRLGTSVSVTNNGVTFDARGATISGDSDNLILISFNGVVGATVLGGRWELNGAYLDTSRHALRFNVGSSDVSVVGAEFVNCVGFAVGVYGTDASPTSGVNIEGCRFLGTLGESVLGEGDAYYQGVSNVQHHNNQHFPDATNPSAHGVFFVADALIHWEDVSVSGNIMSGHAWRGVSATDEAPVASFDAGVFRVTNNTIRDTGRQGIKTKNIPRLVITSNHIDTTDAVPESATLRGAIMCSSANDFLISQNHIVNAGTDGIRVYGAATATSGNADGTRRSGMIISGNIVTDATDDGISVLERCYDVSVANNVVRSPGSEGIVLLGTNAAAEDHILRASVIGNVVKDAGPQGVRATFVDGLVLSGNIVDGFSSFGIQLGDCTDVTLQGNRSKGGTTFDGLRMTNTTDAIVIGNTLTGNARYGISQGGTQSGVMLLFNDLTGNTTGGSDGTAVHTARGNRGYDREGFFGATPATKQTITGSRGGNAAVASLLTGLANLGLIVDSSSA